MEIWKRDEDGNQDPEHEFEMILDPRELVGCSVRAVRNNSDRTLRALTPDEYAASKRLLRTSLVLTEERKLHGCPRALSVEGRMLIARHSRPAR